MLQHSATARDYPLSGENGPEGANTDSPVQKDQRRGAGSVRAYLLLLPPPLLLLPKHDEESLPGYQIRASQANWKAGRWFRARTPVYATAARSGVRLPCHHQAQAPDNPIVEGPKKTTGSAITIKGTVSGIHDKDRWRSADGGRTRSWRPNPMHPKEQQLLSLTAREIRSVFFVSWHPRHPVDP